MGKKKQKKKRKEKKNQPDEAMTRRTAVIERPYTKQNLIFFFKKSQH